MPPLHHIVRDTREILDKNDNNTLVEISDLTESDVSSLKIRLKDYDVRETIYISRETYNKKTYALHVRKKNA